MTQPHKRTPRTDAEWARSVEQRLRALDSRQTMRFGPWVISHSDGKLLATRPGQPAMEVGSLPAEPTVVDLGRGEYVTEGEVTGAITDGAGETFTDLTEWLNAKFQEFLTQNSLIPIGSLFNGSINRLANPAFTGAVSISSPSGRIEWDPTVYRSTSTDDIEPGSAHIVADGTSVAMRSDPIECKPGQTLKLEINVATRGLTGSGKLLSLTALPYTAGVSGAPVELGSSGVPAGSATWIAPPTGTYKTTTLSGSWIIPAGVDHVALRVELTDAATAGDVWLDDALEASSGLLPPEWVQASDEFSNLAAQLSNYNSKIVAVFEAWGSAGTPEGFQNAVGKLLDLLNISHPDDLATMTQEDFWTAIINSFLKPWSDFAEQSGLNDIVEAVQDAFTDGAAAVDAWLKDMWDSILGFKTTTEVRSQNAENFQITAVTSGYRNPTWVCRYPIGDVVYPEVINQTLYIIDIAIPANTNYRALPGQWIVEQNTSRGGVITVCNTAVFDTVGMVVGKLAGAIDNVFLDVLRISDDTGEAVTVFSKDISTDLGSGAVGQYYEATVSPGIIGQAGEQYIVRLRNESTINTEVSAYGLQQLTVAQPAGWHTTTNTSQSSYTSSEVTAARALVTGQRMIWALLANQSSTANDQLFTDDFNRATLGSRWFLKSSNATQIGLSFGQAAYATDLFPADGNHNALYTLPTASDRMWVEGTLYGTGLNLSGARIGLMLCCNRDLSQVVYLSANINTVKIYSGPWGSLTERASVSSSFNDVPWRFTYNPANKKYEALKNGQSIGLSWTDSGDLMQHGRNFRYGGLRISRVSGTNAGTIDNWLLKDWF